MAVPLLFKQAVDHMAMGSQAVALAAQAILLSGVCKAVSGLANEGRAMAFTPVAQDAGRKVALSIFSHILSLDIEFHMARRTVRSLATLVSLGLTVLATEADLVADLQLL
jgi:ABC-type multidrug transport system fused ATPase/permease subunit